jgi:hypothetical protein
MRGFSKGVDTKSVTQPSPANTDEHPLPLHASSKPDQLRPSMPAPSLPIPKLAVPSKLAEAFVDPDDDESQDCGVLLKSASGVEIARPTSSLDVPDDANVRGRKKSAANSPRQYHHKRGDGGEDEQSPEGTRIGLRPAISRKERTILKVDVDEPRRFARPNGAGGGLRALSEGMELEREEDRDDKEREEEAPSALVAKEESMTHIERLPEKLVLMRSGRKV